MTKFTTGILDSLFGEKVIVELPGPNGTTIERTVTKKWLDEMERQGKATQITEPIVRVHVLTTSGYTVQNWIIGQDVDAATCERFRDPSTADLYMMTVHEAGEPKNYFIEKHLWEQAKQQLDAI